MANNPPEGYTDDFLEQILSLPSYAGLAGADAGNSSDGASLHPPPMFPLGLSLDNGHDDVSGASALAVKPDTEGLNNNMGNLYPAFDHLQAHAIRHPVPQVQQQAFQGQPTPSTTVTVPHPPAIRPRVRARRGQATDPHSIAERVYDY